LFRVDTRLATIARSAKLSGPLRRVSMNTVGASMIFLVAFILAAVSCGDPLWGSDERGALRQPALDVPYEPSSYGIAEEMLKMADVTSRDLVYDLGCGDGRIVIMAAKERGARGVGVDIDPVRIKESRENAEAAGVGHLVRFFEHDLFDTDITSATVVMIYLYPDVNLKLRPKLLTDLRPGSRIVSSTYTMEEWEPDATQRVEGHDLYFFVVPANATGTWQWVNRDRQRTSLHLTQKFQKVKGSITFGEKTYPIMNCSLRGDTLRFSVERRLRGRNEALSFEGRISSNVIDGNVTQGKTGRAKSPWKAMRNGTTRVSIAE
jgi:SAM-dependent methyltransferase